jgi:hypothetical protein
MPGIIPPSIVTYQYTVSNTYDTYVNVSFPFKVKISEVWFTGDAKLLGGNPPEGEDDVFEDSFRILSLAAVKSKSPKTVLSSYDAPSDWAPFFGTADPESQTTVASADSSLKPSMWLGIPDDATAAQLKNSTTHFPGVPIYGAGFRSSSATPPSLNDATNPYWANDDWSSGEFAQNKYKTEMGVMNPDEILTLFLYDEDGDWTDYEGDGLATIHIAYEGVALSIEAEAIKTPWNTWWYD